MIDERFIILAVILSLLGGLDYLLGTLKGTVKPNKVTWLLWSFAPLVAFSAELSQGVKLASLMTFIVGFKPLLIFLASFVNKKSHWKIGTLDIICAVLSVSGLILWYITKSGNIAIIFSILADLLAAIPTVVKSFYTPQTEGYKNYLLDVVGMVITLLILKTWDLANFAFPLYIIFINTLITVLITSKVGSRLRKGSKLLNQHTLD